MTPDNADSTAEQPPLTPATTDDSQNIPQINLNTNTPALEWGIRFVMWGVTFFAFTRFLSQLAGAPTGMLNVMLFSILSAFVFLGTTPVVERFLQKLTQWQPILATLLPLILLLPLPQMMQPDNRFEASEILLTAIALLLPVALAVLNTAYFRWADVILGWFSVFVPLVLPFSRIAPVEPPQWTARLIVGCLPLLLILLTNRSQKQRLNYLFMCGFLSLWATYELGILPVLATDPGIALPIKGLLPGGYMQLGLLAVGFYLTMVAGKFNGLGWRVFDMGMLTSRHEMWRQIIELLVFGAVGLIVIIFSRAYRLNFPLQLPNFAFAYFALFFLLVALPAQLIFQGVLLRYLHQGLGMPAWVAALLSACFFALAALPQLTLPSIAMSSLNTIAADALASPLVSPIEGLLPGMTPIVTPFMSRSFADMLLNFVVGICFARVYLRSLNMMFVSLVHTLFAWFFWLMLKP